WGFIGYMFSIRYIKTDFIGAISISLVMIFIVIQIERQIILTVGRKNTLAKIFRVAIAFVMAIIGSVIIDQTIFKEDIEKKKVSEIQEDVNSILPAKTEQLDVEIANLDTLILIKELERSDIINEVTARIFIKGSISEKRNIKLEVMDVQGIKGNTIYSRTDLTLKDITNPKAQMIPSIDKQITELRNQKSEKEKSRINIRQEIENELKEKTGFLDELDTLFSILFSSIIALIVWLCLFIFFFLIEFFVLVSKFYDDTNDYDKTIMHQMDIKIKMLEKLDRKSV